MIRINGKYFCYKTPEGESKVKRKILIFILLTTMLTGCSKRPVKDLEIPKEIPVFNEEEGTNSEKEQTDIVEDVDTASGIESKSNPQTVTKSKISLQSTTDERSWSTTDDILAKQVDDLLNLQNEIFTAGLEGLRDRDYDVTVTDSDGTKQVYQLWINFVKENEIIVKDESGKLWNISVEDSNKFRSILSSLN